MSAKTTAKEGRAVGRVLITILMLAIALFGLALMGRGAIIPAKAWVAQILLDRAFDQSFAAHRPMKPWPWADMTPVARITVPSLGVSEIVLSGASGQAMAFGPTQLPSRGPVHIMAAHRDTHFAFLQNVHTGDRIEVQSATGKISHYTVKTMQITRWDRFAYPTHPDRPMLALTTCYPFGASEHGPLRYVVWAEEE